MQCKLACTFLLTRPSTSPKRGWRFEWCVSPVCELRAACRNGVCVVAERSEKPVWQCRNVAISLCQLCRCVAMSVLSSPGHGLGCKGWLTVCRRKMWHGPRTQMLRQCPSSTLGNLLHTRAPGVSFGSLCGRIMILHLGLCGSDCVDARWLLQMDANSCRLPRPAVPLRGAALWGGPWWRRRRRAKSTGTV